MTAARDRSLRNEYHQIELILADARTWYPAHTAVQSHSSTPQTVRGLSSARRRSLWEQTSSNQPIATVELAGDQSAGIQAFSQVVLWSSTRIQLRPQNRTSVR